MVGLTPAVICAAAAGQLRVMQGEARVREDQQLTKVLIQSRIRRVKRKCEFLSSCFFQIFPAGSF